MKLPTFEEAVIRMRNLLPEPLRSKDFLWAFREDLAMGTKAPLVLLPALPGNGGLVRALYEDARREDGGLALVCFGIAEDRPCCYLERARDEDQAERLMLPDRGLKASVRTPLPGLETTTSAAVLERANRDWEQLGWEALVSRSDVPSRDTCVGAEPAALHALQRLCTEEGDSLESSALRELLSALERLLPKRLRPTFEFWHREGLDGILPSLVCRNDDGSREIRGVCVLINDQTTTPILLRLRLADDGRSFTVTCRLGDAGHDSGGMTRVAYGGTAMRKMMDRVSATPDDIEWAYELAEVVP